MSVYVIKIHPFLPNRVKLGHSVDVEARLRNYKTISPEVSVIREYQGGQNYEDLLLRGVRENVAGRYVSNEVFEANNIQELLDYADSLFKSLPTPKGEVKKKLNKIKKRDKKVGFLQQAIAESERFFSEKERLEKFCEMIGKKVSRATYYRAKQRFGLREIKL